METGYHNAGFSWNALYDVFQQILGIPLRFLIIICFRGQEVVISIGVGGKRLLWMLLNWKQMATDMVHCPQVWTPRLCFQWPLMQDQTKIPHVTVCVCVCVCAHTCESLSRVRAPLSMEFLPGKNTGVGCHLPLQEIFPTQLGQLERGTKIFIDFHLPLSRFDFFDHWIMFIFFAVSWQTFTMAF